MKDLYAYIFCKSYYFCMKVYKGMEFPQIWAGLFVTFLVITNIIVLLKTIHYIMLPIRINIYPELHKYFAMVALGISIYYIQSNERYKYILVYCSSITKRRNFILRIISILYYVFSVIGFFLITQLLREYNNSNPM
jgi:hypothetical protein